MLIDQHIKIPQIAKDRKQYRFDIQYLTSSMFCILSVYHTLLIPVILKKEYIFFLRHRIHTDHLNLSVTGFFPNSPDRLKRCPMLRDQPILWMRGLYMWHQKSSDPSWLSSQTSLRRPPITCSTSATRVRHRQFLSTTSTRISFLKGYCKFSCTYGDKSYIDLTKAKPLFHHTHCYNYY